MILQVRLFAILRERAGRESVEVEVADGATVDQTLEALGRQHEELASVIDRSSLVMAVNQVYASRDTVLHAEDELALIPPVSGGSGEQPPASGRPPHVRVHGGELSYDRLIEAVRSDAAGAIVTFHGVTREVERLEYEAYLPMAEQRIAAILDDVASAHEVEALAAEHRVGTVPLGQPSVIVAVSAGHRGAAFAAAREAIDRIKAEAPIWKKEVEGERQEWVQGSPPPQG